MKVSLVSISKPRVDGINTAEDLIVYSARVSNPQNQKNLQTGPKLLKYCLDKGHFSIFEMVSMTVEITTSRAIAQQILRHKSFSFQEFSQRYSKVTEFETYEARRQDNKNRQNSIDDMSKEDKEWFLDAQLEIQYQCELYYHKALTRKIAKEQARFLLPLSTQTKLYMSGNVRSFIHYLMLRCGPETQKEHRDIAVEIRNIFCQEFPVIAEALKW